MIHTLSNKYKRDLQLFKIIFQKFLVKSKSIKFSFSCVSYSSTKFDQMQTNSTKMSFGGTRYFYDNMSYLFLYVLLYVISLLIGLFGNFVLIGSIITTKDMRNTTNQIIVNLAIADFSLCLFVYSFTVVGE